MYLFGDDVDRQAESQAILTRLAVDRRRLVTDVEVFQEILHRYQAIDRPDKIQPAYDLLTGLVDEVFPYELVDAERAKAVLLERRGLSARDAVHVAIMQRHRVVQIFSYDHHFDGVPGIERIN
jgi:predicted nucleic acid-binding protein